MIHGSASSMGYVHVRKLNRYGSEGSNPNTGE